MHGVKRDFGGRRNRSEIRVELGPVSIAPAVGVSALLVRLLHERGLPPQLDLGRLPRPAAIYSVAVWPAVWATAEELTYLGYVLFPEPVPVHSGQVAKPEALVPRQAGHDEQGAGVHHAPPDNPPPGDRRRARGSDP